MAERAAAGHTGWQHLARAAWLAEQDGGGAICASVHVFMGAATAGQGRGARGRL